MLAEHARAIAALGGELRPEGFAAAGRLYAPHHAALAPDVAVTRDVAYGPGERQRLDVFAPRGARGRPVVLFVPGGGFVAGDKVVPGSPYYDNVGAWASALGYVGVTMNYALAPSARYPSGARDIAAAVRRLHADVAAFGGDPEAIVLIGQSAGATHAATYAARSRDWPAGRIGVAGIALLSGAYDFRAPDQPPNVLAYFGDAADAAAASPLHGLADADVPLLVAVAEFDPPPFHADAAALAAAVQARTGALPALVVLPGHNHFTEITHLGAAAIDDAILSDHLTAFVARVTRARAVA